MFVGTTGRNPEKRDAQSPYPNQKPNKKSGRGEHPDCGGWIRYGKIFQMSTDHWNWKLQKIGMNGKAWPKYAKNLDGLASTKNKMYNLNTVHSV